MKYQFGAHLSSSGGYHKAVERVHAIGGSCLQLFSSSPRTWKSAVVDDEKIARFLTAREEFKIDPVYFHALYLVNLADSGQTGENSVEALITELNLAHAMNVRGSIVHTGSFKNKDASGSCRLEAAYPTLLSNIQNVLKETPEDTLLILENSGNRKIGQTIEHLAEIIEDVKSPRIRVCLDTCHLHAAGYDLSTPDALNAFLDRFDTLIGHKKLELIHMNDSKDPFQSLRDRHDNIGVGNVGISVFKNLIQNKRTQTLPFIIETPGFDGNGPDEKNLDILKGLAQ